MFDGPLAAIQAINVVVVSSVISTSAKVVSVASVVSTENANSFSPAISTLLPPEPPPVALTVTSPVPVAAPVEEIDMPVPAIILRITALSALSIFKSFRLIDPSSTCPPRICVRPIRYYPLNNLFHLFYLVFYLLN